MIKRSMNKLGDGFEKLMDTGISVLDIADTLALTGRNAAEGTLIESQIELEKSKISGTDELHAMMEPMAESIKRRKKLESVGIVLGRG